MSGAGRIAAIARKDLTEFARDRLWMVLTPMVLVVFAAVFWLLPAEAERPLAIGVTPAPLAFALELAARAGGGDPAADGWRIVPFADEAALAAAVADGTRDAADGPDRTPPLQIGLAFRPDFLTAVAQGREAVVRVHADASVPAELRTALGGAVREAAYLASGSPPPVSLPADGAVVLGPGRDAVPVPLRERMRPLLAFFVLLTESLALASLLASEVASRTLAAVLATPARVVEVIIAKGLVGSGLAFAQAVLLLMITGAFALGANPLPLLAAVAIGSVLMAGAALLTGAAGGDFMTTLFLGVAVMLPLTVPAVTLLLPGSDALWVRALPSYGVVHALVGAASHGDGFGALAGPLASGAAWAAVVFAAGAWILSRRAARS